MFLEKKQEQDAVAEKQVKDVAEKQVKGVAEKRAVAEKSVVAAEPVKDALENVNFNF